MNSLIFEVNLRLFLLPLEAKLLDVLSLFIQLDLLISDPSFKCLDFSLNISELILCQLDFTF